jgi:hypothetical protein
MKKGKRFVIKFLIVLVSFIFIDGGRSLFLITNSIQINSVQDHVNDVEIPHQQNFAYSYDDEKMLEIFKYDSAAFNLDSIKFFFAQNIVSQDFSDSIWQPPKFV